MVYQLPHTYHFACRQEKQEYSFWKRFENSTDSHDLKTQYHHLYNVAATQININLKETVYM